MLIVFLVVLAIIIFYALGLYNTLIGAKAKVDEAWSGIDIQLKRRVDLIPNLVETVKGYAKHEKGVFEEVTKARSALMSAKAPQDKAQANNELTSALKTLFAVAENYPDLKANENFKDLQVNLQDTEDKIAYSRQFYNANVMDFNIKVRIFPNVLIAGLLGFSAVDFFAATEEERKAIKVQF